MTTFAERTLRLVRTRAASRALRYLPATAVLVDTLMILGAVVIGVVARARLSIFDDPANTIDSVVYVAPPALIGWLLVIYFLRGYRENIFGAGTDEYVRVLNASLYTAALVGVGCYLAKFPLSRGFFVINFVVGTLLLLLGRMLLRRAVHLARRYGSLRERVLIVGAPSHVDEIAGILARENWLGYEVIGALSPSTDAVTATDSGIPILGGIDEISSAVASDVADVVFFAEGAIETGEQMRRVVWDLEQHRVKLVVAPSVTDVSAQRIRVRPVGGLPLMHISPPTARDAASIGKRAFDLLGALVLIVVFAPLLAIIAINIKLADRGPVLFKQVRTGRHGEEFPCLKFRTMVVDAEARLEALKSELGFEGGLFKMKDDPRITKPGQWLRRLSLDELPQLFNVVRGEMSLVGPRPPLPSEVAEYDGDTTRRLHVRPGMTGLWQVSGRSDLSFEEAVRLDLYYVDNWSMLQDLSILAKTVSAVFSSRGAY